MPERADWYGADDPPIKPLADFFNLDHRTCEGCGRGGFRADGLAKRACGRILCAGCNAAQGDDEPTLLERLNEETE